MTLALIRKGLLLEGSNPKTKDKQVAGIYMFCKYFVFLPGVIFACHGGSCWVPLWIADR